MSIGTYAVADEKILAKYQYDHTVVKSHIIAYIDAYNDTLFA